MADKFYVVEPGGETVQKEGGTGGGDMYKATYDPASKNAQLAALTDLAVDANLSAGAQDAVAKKHANTLDHDGGAQDTAIAGKTTLAAVKADVDIADAISKKHSNALDHSDYLDHDGSVQDTAIAGKTTLTAVKADADIADAISKKHAAAHSHPESEITNLVNDLAAKEPANANIQTHVTSAHAPANAQKNSDITKAEIEAKLTGEITSHSHPGGGGESEIVVVKVGDTSNATTSLADAAGLTFTALANKTYIIEALIRYATSVTTVGIQLSASGPASPAFVAGLWDVNAAQGTPDGGAFNAWNVTVAASAAPFTTDNLARLHCLFRNGSTQGPFIIRFAAETTGTITIKDGSALRYRQLD